MIPNDYIDIYVGAFTHPRVQCFVFLSTPLVIKVVVEYARARFHLLVSCPVSYMIFTVNFSKTVIVRQRKIYLSPKAIPSSTALLAGWRSTCKIPVNAATAIGAPGATN